MGPPRDDEEGEDLKGKGKGELSKRAFFRSEARLSYLNMCFEGWTSWGEATGDSSDTSSSSAPAAATGWNMCGDAGMDSVVDDDDECVGVVGLLKGSVTSAATDAGDDEAALAGAPAAGPWGGGGGERGICTCGRSSTGTGIGTGT